MKRLRIIFSVIYFCVFSSFGQKVGDTLKIQIKSCKILYASRDSFTDYTPRLRYFIFDDFGTVSKEILHLVYDSTLKKSPNPPRRKLKSVNELRIYLPEFKYTINLNDSTVEKHLSNVLLFGTSSGRVIRQDDLVSYDTLQGRPCIVLSTNDRHHGGLCTKTWYWKGLILRQEYLTTGDFYYAKIIDENYVIRFDEFNVPDFAKIRDFTRIKD